MLAPITLTAALEAYEICGPEMPIGVAYFLNGHDLSSSDDLSYFILARDVREYYNPHLIFRLELSDA